MGAHVDLEEKLDKATQWLREADGLLITAGAGMGVDSGLPDFRGAEGFWRAYPALGHQQLSFEDMANPASFSTQPTLAWGFYGHRLALYRETQPHAGFDILRKWGERMQHGAFVFTSNVDGQFQKAGFPPSNVAECHGTIRSLQCIEPCTTDAWSAEGFEPEIDEATGRKAGATQHLDVRRLGLGRTVFRAATGPVGSMAPRAAAPCSGRDGGRQGIADCPPIQRAAWPACHSNKPA
jgi:hypothetical protein